MAKSRGIVDQPNNRTMHSGAVVRGGGILFTISFLTWSVISSPPILLVVAWLLLALISYIDDIRNVPGALRLLVQLAAMIIIFIYLGLFDTWPLGLTIVVLIVSAGILNAYNFMDGINGITAAYSASVLTLMIIINNTVVTFVDGDLLALSLLSVLAFGVFNFRKKALCFAGDIGSVMAGFLVVFLILKLILATGTFIWVLLLLIYGLDVVITIIQRLQNRENIFDAHKKHLFQVAVYKLGKSHLFISSLYGVVQFFVGVVILAVYSFDFERQLSWSLVILATGAFLYIYIKTKITGSVWISENY